VHSLLAGAGHANIALPAVFEDDHDKDVVLNIGWKEITVRKTSELSLPVTTPQIFEIECRYSNLRPFQNYHALRHVLLGTTVVVLHCCQAIQVRPVPRTSERDPAHWQEGGFVYPFTCRRKFFDRS